MQPGSIIAVYVLFWTLSLFLILPFGVRTSEESGGQAERGHAESAPHQFQLGRAALRATIVSAILFGLFYANYVNGWITIDMVDWAAPPER
jgi:predicted secreted protein